MLNNEYKNSSMKIFSLKGNEPLAQEVADHVGIELGKCSVKRFSDGEIQINIEESIRGCDVFIVQPTSYPVNLHLMELLIMIDACKRASAANINSRCQSYDRIRLTCTSDPRILRYSY